MISKDIVVLNETGIHTRPASVLVSTAAKFKSNITIANSIKKANAKSIINILALGLSKGSNITISAEGDDEGEAVEVITALFENKFGE